MSVTFLSRGPIRVEALVAEVASPLRGATAIFLGTVRAAPEDGPVSRIEYSGYDEMVEAEWSRITAEAGQRWPEVAVVGRHRLGDVPLGEASMAVAVGAGHRADALDACRWVVEEAKHRLPVWKREVFRDGTTAWRDNAGGREPGTPAMGT
jgi:molybdopterin synthase catalytic subunit